MNRNACLLALGMLIATGAAAAEPPSFDDAIWDYVMQPGTNYAPNFSFADWSVDNRRSLDRRTRTAPTLFRISHVHMNFHGEHLDTDPNMGAPFFRFHHSFLSGFNAWRMERGLDRLVAYRPCAPIPVGHTHFNLDLPRADGVAPTGDCQPLASAHRMPPYGTLSSYPSINALGIAVNSSLHAGLHHGIAYLSFDDFGQAADIVSTDKTMFDPMFWLLHAQVDDLSETYRRTQPTDWVVALDRSGSQDAAAGGVVNTNRLGAWKEGVQFLSQLLPANGGHRLGLVSFNTNAMVNLPLTAVDSATFATNVRTALATVPAPAGATSLGAGVQAALIQATNAGSPNQQVWLLTDGAENATPWFTPWRPGSPRVPEELDQSLQHHDQFLVPVHALMAGPGFLGASGRLPAATLARAGHYASGDASAFAVKQLVLASFAETLDVFATAGGDGALAAGAGATTPVDYTSPGDAWLMFVLVWEQPAAASSVRLEVTTPGGAPLNLAAPGVTSRVGPTWQIVQLATPPPGGNAGRWSLRAVRTGPGAAQRTWSGVLVRGPARVEPSPPRSREFAGDALRPVFRVREPYWPTNGFTSVTASVRVYGPAAGAGEVLSGRSLLPATVQSGDPVSARNATLASYAATNGALNGTNLLGVFALNDQGTGGDAVAGDHYFSADLADLARFEGEYQFRAQFTFQQGGVSFTREAAYSTRVDLRLGPAGAISVSAPVAVGAGTNEVTWRFRPQDAQGMRWGSGRSNDLVLTGTDGAVAAAPPVDHGDGTYSVRLRYAADRPQPRIVIRQPGTAPVVVGDNPAVAFVDLPRFVPQRPTNAVLIWETTVPTTTVVEYGPTNGPMNGRFTNSLRATSHRLVLPGLQAGRGWQYRVQALADTGVAVSPVARFETPRNAVRRVELDKMAFNDPVANLITGRFVLYEPAAETVTVPVGTTQIFNLQHALTNATAEVTIPAGATVVPFAIPAGPVTNDVEVIVLPFYGDLNAHGLCKLLAPTFQVMTATNVAGPYQTNTTASVNPYYRTIRDPFCGPSGFVRLLSPEAAILRVVAGNTNELRLSY